MKKLMALVALGLATMWISVALGAQEAAGAAAKEGCACLLDWSKLFQGFIESIVYSILGVIVLIVAYKVIGWIVPFDLNKELSEDDNPAVGVFMAGIFVAIGLVIASAIG